MHTFLFKRFLLNGVVSVMARDSSLSGDTLLWSSNLELHLVVFVKTNMADRVFFLLLLLPAVVRLRAAPQSSCHESNMTLNLHQSLLGQRGRAVDAQGGVESSGDCRVVVWSCGLFSSTAARARSCFSFPLLLSDEAIMLLPN